MQNLSYLIHQKILNDKFVVAGEGSLMMLVDWISVNLCWALTSFEIMTMMSEVSLSRTSRALLQMVFANCREEHWLDLDIYCVLILTVSRPMADEVICKVSIVKSFTFGSSQHLGRTRSSPSLFCILNLSDMFLRPWFNWNFLLRFFRKASFHRGTSQRSD